MEKGKVIYFSDVSDSGAYQVIAEKIVVEDRYEKKTVYSGRECHCFEDSRGHYRELPTYLCFENLNDLFKEIENSFNGNLTTSPYMW